MLLAAAASSLPAQVVTGTVVERGSAPVEGAMVVLLDGDDRPRARTLSDASGRFRVRAPGPGVWRLRVDRIGFASSVSRALTLERGETLVQRLEISAEPIRLEGVRAGGERRCVLRPEEGAQVHRLWQEVRKALAAAAWTDSVDAYRYRLTHFDRELEPDRLRVRSERLEPSRGFWRNPYESLPAEELLEDGFVRETGDGLVYSAPDADVLLSDPFLDTHCLRIEGMGADEPVRGLLGLAFEPIPGRRGVPEIAGVLWVEPRTAELRRLEFEYAGLGSVGLAAGQEHAGGTVIFHALPNGAWIIREWAIRMPVVEETRAQIPELAMGRVPVTGHEVVAIHEQGSRVEEVRGPQGRIPLGDEPGPDAVEADTAGAPGPAPPAPDSTAKEHVDGPAREEVGRPVRDDVTGPIAAPGAGAPVWTDSVGDLVGVVTDPGTVQGQSGVLVELLDRDGRRVTRTTTDVAGRFRFAAPPPGVYRLRVIRPGRGEVVSEPFPFPSPGGAADTENAPGTEPASAAEPEGPSTRARDPSVIGLVRDPAVDQVLAAVEVELLTEEGNGIEGKTVTDSVGRFHFDALEPGSYRIRITQLSGARETTDAFRVGDDGSSPVLLEVQVRATPIALERLKVVTHRLSGRLTEVGFYRRQVTASGPFITADEIPGSARNLTDILYGYPGVRVVQRGAEEDVMMAGAASRSLSGRVCWASIVIDGTVVRPGGVDAEPWMDLVHPSEIEGLEVYPRSTGLPVEAGGTRSPCGAIVIWTKR